MATICMSLTTNTKLNRIKEFSSKRLCNPKARLFAYRPVRLALDSHGLSVVSDTSTRASSPKLKENVVYDNHNPKLLSTQQQQQPFTLPVLDFANIEDLKPGTSSWLSACSRVREALEEYSCFVVSYDKISQELKEDVYGGVKELFDLPIETKKGYNVWRSGIGYFISARDPLFESMTVQDTNNVETVEDFINCMLPSSSDPLLGKKMNEYRKKVEELQLVIMRMLFESYGMEKYFDSHRESTVYYFRLMKYRVPKPEEIKAGLGLTPHTDLTFITVLNSSQAQGLEIKAKDGTWIPAYLSPSSFLVITGDAMQAWSNGRIGSCVHRVTMTATEPRYANGFFFMHKGTVEAPKEMVDEAHPLLYRPFQHSGLVRFALSEGANLLGPDRLQAYSGIN